MTSSAYLSSRAGNYKEGSDLLQFKPLNETHMHKNVQHVYAQALQHAHRSLSAYTV